MCEQLHASAELTCTVQLRCCNMCAWAAPLGLLVCRSHPLAALLSYLVGADPDPDPTHLPAGTFRGSVAQVARGARSVQLDDGSILYREETGVQHEAKYGNCRVVGEPLGRCVRANHWVMAVPLGDGRPSSLVLWMPALCP